MTGHFRLRIAILLLLSMVVVAVFYAVIGPMRDGYREALVESGNLNALKQHLKAQLSALASGDAAGGLTDSTAWPGIERNEIETRIQDKVLAISEANALQLTSFGPAAPPDGLKLPGVGYQIEAVVNWENLLRFISDIGGIVPALAISELSVRGAPLGLDQVEPKLYLRMVIWGMAPETGAAP